MHVVSQGLCTRELLLSEATLLYFCSWLSPYHGGGDCLMNDTSQPLADNHDEGEVYTLLSVAPLGPNARHELGAL